MKFIKQIFRIILSIPLCLLGLHLFSLGDFGNMIMFMAIYIGVSLMLEPLFNYWKKKQNKKTK